MEDHLLALDHLKQGNRSGLVTGRRIPLVEYKKESFDMFQAMLDRIGHQPTIRLALQPPGSFRAAPDELQRRRAAPSLDR